MSTKKISSVLLVRPPFYSLFGTETKAGSIPLGICYIAAILEKNGYKVDILDCETMNIVKREDAGKMKTFYKINTEYDHFTKIMNPKRKLWEHILEKILSKKHDVIGFSSGTFHMSSVIYLSNMIKKERSTPIILGGCHPTVMPILSLKETKADFTVMGEGESTIIELLKYLSKKNNDIKNIKGIAYCNNGDCKINEPRERIENLDELPFPARHLLNPKLYKKEAFGYVISSRGCPFNCSFCSSHTMWGRHTRLRSAKNMVDEIELVYNKYGTKEFRFADDLFPINIQRVKDFAKEIKNRKLDISFRCGSRVDTINKEVLSYLKDAGCKKISFGVESGNQRILNLINKKITLEQSKKAIKMTQDAGIKAIAFFMVGHPTETLKELQDTIDLMDDLNAWRSLVNLTTPHPGTELRNFLNEKDLDKHWWKYYFQGKAFGKPLANIQKDKIDEAYAIISEWATKKNLGENVEKPKLI